MLGQELVIVIQELTRVLVAVIIELALATVNQDLIAYVIQEPQRVLVTATPELAVAAALAELLHHVIVSLEPQPPARATHEQFVIVIQELHVNATQLAAQCAVPARLATVMQEL
jgi:hypothetical protein